MAKQEEAKPKAKATRKMLTPQERVAKLEAEVAAAKARLHDKDRKALSTLGEKRGALVSKITELTSKVEAIDTEVAEISKRLPSDAASTPEV